MKPRTCNYCGVEYTPPGSRSKFCCIPCSARGRHKPARINRPSTSLRVVYTERSCAWCATPLSRSQLANKRTFCSHKCARLHQHQGRPLRHLSSAGYVKVRLSEEQKQERGKPYEFEHRLVMEGMLGRRLTGSENVHHKNGDRADNRTRNLELWKKSQPSGVRVTGIHCPGCTCH